MITLDIESEAIEEGKPLLPKPVGFAIRWPDGNSRYFAFGHPEENNCSWDEARAVLESIWGAELLTHNGCVFDIPVLQHWFGLADRDPLLTHDTLFLAYLHNPHARSLSLKDLADDWLGIAPDERDELYDWLVLNVPECRTRKGAGAYIARAPGGLVGRYAASDVHMTWHLYQHLSEVAENMAEAYARERMLAPILADIQNRGVTCDTTRLEEDYALATKELHRLDDQVRRELKDPTVNPDSSAALVSALQKAGFSGFLLTPGGKPSANKESLDRVLAAAPELQALLKRRATFSTLTGTFMHSWLDITRATGGRIHAQYNQVRNPDGFGTRTGRLSSSKPNFQNVPNDLGPGIPKMKSYLLPEEGHIWTCGDFKNQEPRLAAHFEDGALGEAFRTNPELDPYMFVVEVLQNTVARKEAKAIFLGLLYSQGAALLADKLGCDVQRATLLRNIIKGAIPDVVALDNDCKARFRRDLPIRTLGGRIYFCEPPSNGRDWSYKALNSLIQGSAADQTKQALIFAAKEFRLLDPSIRILGTVHDEYSVSHPPELLAQVEEIMQLSANNLPCDVPMLMDIASGANWAEAK